MKMLFCRDEYDTIAYPETMSIEEAVKWYGKEYGIEIDELDFEEVDENKLMWVECDIAEIPEDVDERIKAMGESIEGDITRVNGSVYILKKFKDVVCESKTPYVIATTEW